MGLREMEEGNQINYLFVGLTIGFGFLALFLFVQNMAYRDVLENNINVIIDNQEWLWDNMETLGYNQELIMTNQETLYDEIEYYCSSSTYSSQNLRDESLMSLEPSLFYDEEKLVCELPEAN